MTESVMLNQEMSRAELQVACKENNCDLLETAFVISCVEGVFKDPISLTNIRTVYNMMNVFRGFTQGLVYSEVSHKFRANKKKIDALTSTLHHALIGLLVKPGEWYSREIEGKEINKELFNEFVEAAENGFKDYHLTPDFLLEVATKIPFFIGYSLYVFEYMRHYIRKDMDHKALTRKFTLGIVAYFSELIPERFYNLKELLGDE